LDADAAGAGAAAEPVDGSTFSGADGDDGGAVVDDGEPHAASRHSTRDFMRTTYHYT
jgi:hypothetical protein